MKLLLGSLIFSLLIGPFVHLKAQEDDSPSSDIQDNPGGGNEAPEGDTPPPVENSDDAGSDASDSEGELQPVNTMDSQPAPEE
jgi:hypothetical protein